MAVWQAAAQAVGRARAGGGPSFIEASTYRIRGHFEAESFVLAGGRYRDDAEIGEWRTRDPIERLGSRLIASGIADAVGRCRTSVAGAADRQGAQLARASLGQRVA